MYKWRRDVSVEEFFDTCGTLLEDHWSELANNKHAIKLNPNVEQYKKLQEIGVLKNICVFDAEGKMVAYSVLIAMPHIHYKDDLFVSVDVLFVAEKHRKSSLGVRLIMETEKYAKELGASILTYHTKPTHPAIETLLKHAKYTHVENIFGKLLKGE